MASTFGPTSLVVQEVIIEAAVKAYLSRLNGSAALPEGVLACAVGRLCDTCLTVWLDVRSAGRQACSFGCSDRSLRWRDPRSCGECCLLSPAAHLRTCS